MSVTERSTSRGRQPFVSTGRGGVGNIRQPSLSGDARPESGPDNYSLTRGREPFCSPMQIFSTGRGGAGNIRSPSRDDRKVPNSEKDVIEEYKRSQEGAPVSSGRGGVGNISRSRTRDSATIPIVPSTVRGGVGNIVAGNGSVAKSDFKDEKHHSTVQGGNANSTIKQPSSETVTNLLGAEKNLKETN